MNPEVSRETLLHLLTLGEHTHLDYKETVNLDNKTNAAEFAKDVAAFSDRGGWIIIGVDNHETPVGISEDQIHAWDEANLRNKIQKYLSDGFNLHVKVHTLTDHPHHSKPLALVLIHVLPHPNGACVMTSDAHDSNSRKSTKTIFRKNDIYTRHGSRSEKIDGTDLDRILDKRSQIKEDQDTSAKYARAAVYQDIKSEHLQAPTKDNLWMRMGFKYSKIPTDFNSKLFYDQNARPFSDIFRSTLEGKHLRRDGHHYDNHIEMSADELISSGKITHGDDPESSIDVRISSNGAISIAAVEQNKDWTYTDLFAWWVHGATEVADIYANALGMHGDLFISCRTVVKDKVFGNRIEEITHIEHESFQNRQSWQRVFELSNAIMSKFSAENWRAESPASYSMEEREERFFPLTLR